MNDCIIAGCKNATRFNDFDLYCQLHTNKMKKLIRSGSYIPAASVFLPTYIATMKNIHLFLG